MINELAALEKKVSRIVSLYRSLRSENDDLRARLERMQDERNRLEKSVADARQRLEALVAQIPETDL
ncbi:MAG: hypothetical protein FWD77_05525 [Betaproteobacteria bacterium]|nr:hypothetical protein [Betaproteobacteria bacterium]